MRADGAWWDLPASGQTIDPAATTQAISPCPVKAEWTAWSASGPKSGKHVGYTRFGHRQGRLVVAPLKRKVGGSTRP
jgi:hypothetical protein